MIFNIMKQKILFFCVLIHTMIAIELSW